jgi:hypothetical protein
MAATAVAEGKAAKETGDSEKVDGEKASVAEPAAALTTASAAEGGSKMAKKTKPKAKPHRRGRAKHR